MKLLKGDKQILLDAGYLEKDMQQIEKAITKTMIGEIAMEINYTKRVPKTIQKRTIENIQVYNLSLTDAFEEAVRELARKGTELWKAWYYNDFRAFLPQIYEEKYLDFEKYPLGY